MRQCTTDLLTVNREIVLPMLKVISKALVIGLAMASPAMAQDRIRIASDWGEVIANLADNDAARSLVEMLPLTIAMRDHLRQEKTGTLPAPMPEVERQLDFATGTLGLWGPDHFVIYYRDGRVPPPGSLYLGK